MKKTIFIVVITFIIISSYQTEIPLTATEFASNLGKGFDVTWSEFTKYMKAYKAIVPKHFSEAGFKNVRIRMNNGSPNATFMNALKQQVSDCLQNNIYPILAYQGYYLQEQNITDAQASAHLTKWWGDMAVAFKGMSNKIAFNILIQISGNYKSNPNVINSFYQSVYDEVRKVDSTRILIYPPVSLSNPDYLKNLTIPGNNSDAYVMAEWHFYAAGPNPDTKSKKYWVDGSTLQERSGVTQPLKTALQWMNTTNYQTWVGAWMAGNYNTGNNFDLIQQVRFGSFMSRQLAKANIPWSINADNKFYDFTNYNWFTTTTDAGGRPVLDAILDSQKIAVYSSINYGGQINRLGVGVYDQAALTSMGIISINSMMVPIDYKVTLQSAQIITNGDVLYLENSTPNLNGFNVAIMKVEYA